MLNELMRECRNYFCMDDKAVTGAISIEGGRIADLQLLPGQYFLISGSIVNDGLHKEYDVLTDETFTGTVTPLAVPLAFIQLSERIDEWSANNAPSALQSESFNGYSYSRASGKDGGQMTWKDAFRNEINTWRKL